MTEYIQPPDERIETAGITNLFRMHLSKNYGSSITRSFNDTRDNYYHDIELHCPICKLDYSINGDSCSDPQYGGVLFHPIHPKKLKVVFENKVDEPGKVGPPRIVCDECEPRESYRNFKELNAKCGRCDTVLQAGEIGNEHKDIVDVYMLKIMELEEDSYCTTQFLKGMMSMKNIMTANRLKAQHHLEKKHAPKQKQDLWKITNSGVRRLKEISEPLHTDLLNKRLEEFLTERRENIQEYVQLSISTSETTGIIPIENKIKQSKSSYNISHIPSEWLDGIFKSDHKEFWGSLTA